MRTLFKTASKPRSLCADDSIAFYTFCSFFPPSSTLMKYFHTESMGLPPCAISNWKIPVDKQSDSTQYMF